VRVAIVGAGLSGIAAAIELGRRGIDDVVLFEAADELGGTWYHNTYPGIACDVPSYLYCFSYAQRSDWERPCPPGQAIHRYVREVADEFGVTPKVRLSTEIAAATWDEGAARWTLETAAGERAEADALVVACGQLNRPNWPRIEGVEAFAGHSFHSARWDHDYDLAGKRVAVIGTGASAVQFVPEVAEAAAHTTVYQRTGNWFMPRYNPTYPRWVRWLFNRVPGMQSARRAFMYWFMESIVLGLTKVRLLGWTSRMCSTAFMRFQLRDPEVRRKAWPDFRFGCKRILFSSSYLPALQRPDVELVTDGIERITEGGVVAGGVERPADCIIYGTGFRSHDFVLPMQVRGAGGRELQETWHDGAQAHLGITVSGFPNLFLMYGPNTNLGVGSIIVMIEAQARYIASALEHVRRLGVAAIDVRPEVQAASGRRVQERLDGSVWTQCRSWYRDAATGRVVNNWPGFMTEYVHRTREIRPDEFRVVEPQREPVAA
jgi:cation diffusion facilitator CzcD-associated flavoprotein CzcO